MGYMQQPGFLGKDGLATAKQLRHTFDQAGLQVSPDVITTAHAKGDDNDPTDTFNVRGSFNYETLSMTVTDPASQKSKELRVQNTAAFADGYWYTGSIVMVNNTEVRNLPEDDRLCIGMQGEKSNHTRRYAKQIIAALKS